MKPVAAAAILRVTTATIGNWCRSKLLKAEYEPHGKLPRWIIDSDSVYALKLRFEREGWPKRGGYRGADDKVIADAAREWRRLYGEFWADLRNPVDAAPLNAARKFLIAAIDAERERGGK
jgi:hypothetical protein